MLQFYMNKLSRQKTTNTNTNSKSNTLPSFSTWLQNVKSSLFWNVDINKLDPKEHMLLIIERVLEYGDVEDFWFIRKFYGTKTLKQALPKIYLTPKSRNLWELVLN